MINSFVVSKPPIPGKRAYIMNLTSKDRYREGEIIEIAKST